MDRIKPVLEPDDRETPLIIPPNFNEFPEEKVTPHDYTWPINVPNLCARDEKVDLLVMVAGATWEFKRREILRRTWAGTILQANLENVRLIDGLRKFL